MDWYYCADGKTVEGPLPEEQLLKSAAEGALTAQSQVVAVGSTEWKPLGAVFPDACRPSPSPPPPLPPGASVPHPPVEIAAKSTKSWFGRLGLLGRTAVVCGAGFFLLIVLGAAAGPDRQQLQAELGQIDSELYQLYVAANQQKAMVSAAEWDQAVGILAMAQGAWQNDEHRVWEGAGATLHGGLSAHQAEMPLKQIAGRAQQLLIRRDEILAQLR